MALYLWCFKDSRFWLVSNGSYDLWESVHNGFNAFMEFYWNFNNYAILRDSLASIRFVAKKISLKIKQRLQKDFGPIVIPHRPEPCSAMCEFWWNWVMLRTIPSKVCINVLTSPCSYTHFDSMGMIEPHLKLLGPHGVSVWFVSDRTRLSIQSITRVLYMTSKNGAPL